MLLQLVVDLVLHPLVLAVFIGLADTREAHTNSLGNVAGTQVRGEDQDRVLEVHHSTLRVSQTAVFQNLQQGVVNLLVGLLNLVEKHDGERLAAHLLGELTALFVADVPGRSTEETRSGEAVMELTHINLNECVFLAKEELGQGLRQLGLTNTGRTGEDERTGRTLRVLQTSAGTTNSAGDSTDSLFLTDDALVQLILHAQQTRGLFLGELEHRNARPGSEDLRNLLLANLSDGVGLARTPLLLALAALFTQLALLVAQTSCLLEVLLVDGGFLLAAHIGNLGVNLLQVSRGSHALDAHTSTSLINKVNSLIRQEAVVDVAIREGSGGNQCLVRDGYAVVSLVLIADTAQNLNSEIHARLRHVHRLETTLKSGVLLDVLTVLIQSGSTDGLQLTASQLRLQNRGRVNCALCSTGTDQRVNLVNKQDDVTALVNLLEHLLQTLLEVTAVTGARNQRAQVEGVKLLILQSLRHATIDDVQREPLHNGGLTNARLTNQNRVVLGAARKNLHNALDFLLAANNRIQLALTCSNGQVTTELIEHQRTGLVVTLLHTSAGSSTDRTLLRRTIGLIALETAEQLNNLLTYARQVSAELNQDLSGNTFALTNQAEQQVLSTDVLVTQLQSLAQRVLQHLLCTRGKRHVTARRLGATTNNVDHLRAHSIQGNTHGLQRLGSHTVAFTNQAEQDVLRADVIVIELACLILCQDDNATCSVRKPLEHHCPFKCLFLP